MIKLESFLLLALHIQFPYLSLTTSKSSYLGRRDDFAGLMSAVGPVQRPQLSAMTGDAAILGAHFQGFARFSCRLASSV